MNPGQRAASLFGFLTAIFLMVAASSAEASPLDSVLVVPNPYNMSARLYGPSGGTAGAFEYIYFRNLPTPSASGPTIIRIYTSNLNLVTTLEHTTSTSLAWDQRNSDNQYIVSDVYLYVITHPDHGTSYGKFIVLR